MSPVFSVIIPVRNEAAGLEEAVARLRRSAEGAALEVVIVDGQSSDGTPDIARRLADRFETAPAPGRAAQMDLGARAASGDVLIFLHADTRLPPDWPALLRRECPSFFGGPANGLSAPSDKPGRPLAAAAASFRLSFDSNKPVYRLIEFLTRFRGRMTGVPHGDQALVVPRAVYVAAGGFPHVPLMEEYYIAPRLKRLGKLKVLSEKVVTSCRRYEKRGPVRTALRNVGIVLLHRLGVPPRVLARWYKALIVGASLAALSSPVAAFDHTHGRFAKALAAHVRNERVDYAALKADPADLDAYLDELAAVPRKEFDAWTRAQQLAYHYNLYNAQTLRLIIDHYPKIDSIKDIGHVLKGPWDQPVVRLFGEKITLGHHEHQIIRPLYNEPRGHFALVCAAKGCPALRGEPYVADRLDRQLDEQGRRFMADPARNRVDAAAKVVHLSPIFDWFEEDFVKRSGSVLAFVAPYFPEGQGRLALKDGFTIRFTDYDWSLNDVAP